jgi:queuine tRNA-ribosyltransferase
MQLDDVIATTSPDHARIEEATHRSIRWLDRCIAAHANPTTQNLFCIIQGGLSLPLRRACTLAMLARDTPGIAIGGLSGGEAKPDFCRVVSACTQLLPAHKPRYVMGVGFPEDILVCIALGADMFDCVWPTRTARFGNAITDRGSVNLKRATFAGDFGPIEDGCRCICCRAPGDDGGLGITRAYVHHLVAKETAGAHLLSMHNVHYQLNLVRRAREAIIEGVFPEFLRAYWRGLYDGVKEKYPQWAVDALAEVGVDLRAD